MKILLVLILLVATFTSYGQPKIESIATQEKVISGYLEGYHHITISLKYHTHSCCHMNAYSVDGWYYYEKYKKKIPLVGFYYSGNLYLYNFVDEEQAAAVLALDYPEDNFWDQMRHYTELSDYNERFVFIREEDRIFSNWRKGEKELSFNFYPTNYEVYETKEYLVMESGKYVDLENYSRYMHGFKVVSHDSDTDKYMLSFSYGSRAYVMGMCGAGEETGYAILSLDDDNFIIEEQIVYVESCMEVISTTKKVNTKNGFDYEVWTGESDSTYRVIIDTVACSIVQKSL